MGSAESSSNVGGGMAELNDWMIRVLARDEGQGVIEYTLVAGVISLTLFVAFTTSGIADGIGRAVSAIVNEMP